MLVIALAGASFFGEAPPELDILGLSAAATSLALILVLGLGALWAGRSLTREDERPARSALIPSDRSVAIWAVACLAVIVPTGIAGLKLLFW